VLSCMPNGMYKYCGLLLQHRCFRFRRYRNIHSAFRICWYKIIFVAVFRYILSALNIPSESIGLAWTNSEHCNFGSLQELHSASSVTSSSRLKVFAVRCGQMRSALLSWLHLMESLLQDLLPKGHLRAFPATVHLPLLVPELDLTPELRVHHLLVRMHPLVHSHFSSNFVGAYTAWGVYTSDFIPILHASGFSSF
jgi:hypothetical protein